MEHLVINSEKEIEYVIRTTENKNGEDECTLYSSSTASLWNENFRNQPLLTITNTGNGYVVSQKFGKNLDYSKATELLILLKFLNATTNLAGSYTIVNPINVTSL